MPRAGYDGPHASEFIHMQTPVEQMSVSSSDIIGKDFQGRQGTYQVTQIIDPTKIRVHYTSGPWQGKIVDMNYNTHYNMQRSHALSRQQALRKVEILLDTWYEMYPALYNEAYGDGTNLESAMLRFLETNYQHAASNVIENARHDLVEEGLADV